MASLSLPWTLKKMIFSYKTAFNLKLLRTKVEEDAIKSIENIR